MMSLPVKVAQIPKILEKLEGKEGTLHLENFSDESDTATFDIWRFSGKMQDKTKKIEKVMKFY